MASWGNAAGTQNVQNMESPAGNFNTLKVNDVHDAGNPGTARVATHSINSGTNAGDRALKVEGLSELAGRASIVNVDAGNPTLLVTNTSDTAIAASVQGKVSILANQAGNPASTGLDVTNGSTHANARALKSTGKSEFVGNIFTQSGSYGTLLIEDVNNGNDDKIAANFINSSTDVDARALKVQGKTEVVNNRADVALGISNSSTDGAARGLKVNGATELVANAPGTPTTALTVTNEDDGAGAYALVVTGVSEMDGPLSVIRDVAAVPALHVENTDTTSTSRAIHAQGTTEAVAISAGNPSTKALLATNESTHADARALVVSGKAEIPTMVGNTSVDGNLTVDGDLSTTEDLNVDGGLTVDQTSTLTGAVTASNTLAVTGAATLSSTLAVTGAVTVGPNNAAGRIDAVPTGGGAANNLEVGGQGSTADVRLGHANHTIDMFAQTRLNSLGCVVNGAAAVNSLASGAGFVYNGAGHGGGPSIDFYLAGVMVRYVDATGWN